MGKEDFNPRGHSFLLQVRSKWAVRLKNGQNRHFGHFWDVVEPSILTCLDLPEFPWQIMVRFPRKTRKNSFWGCHFLSKKFVTFQLLVKIWPFEDLQSSGWSRWLYLSGKWTFIYRIYEEWILGANFDTLSFTFRIHMVILGSFLDQKFRFWQPTEHWLAWMAVPKWEMD